MDEQINIKDLEYPINLIYAVTEDTEVLENSDTILDLNGSVEYVLNTLTDRERKVLKYRFSDLLTYEKTGKLFGVTRERIRQVEAKALRKLRHPQRKKYLILGVSGVIDNIKEKYNERVIDIEERLIEICKLNEKKADEIVHDANLRKKYHTEQIENCDFSVRTYNCLKRAGIKTIGELSKLNKNDLCNIRNLGSKGFNEILNKLQEYGYSDRSDAT